MRTGFEAGQSINSCRETLAAEGKSNSQSYVYAGTKDGVFVSGLQSISKGQEWRLRQPWSMLVFLVFLVVLIFPRHPILRFPSLISRLGAVKRGFGRYAC